MYTLSNNHISAIEQLLNHTTVFKGQEFWVLSISCILILKCTKIQNYVVSLFFFFFISNKYFAQKADTSTNVISLFI